MDSHTLTKYFKKAVSAYYNVALVTAGVSAALHDIDVVEEIASVARIIIAMLLLVNLFKKTVGFEQNKFKSIPLLLLPLGVFSAINSMINNIVDSVFNAVIGFVPVTLPQEVENAIVFVISASITLCICLTLIKKYIERYATLYDEKSSLIFSKELRLSSKWWFIIAGELIGGIAYATLSLFSAFTIPGFTGMFNAVGIIVEYAIIYAIFNAALKTIDKETRKLFVPNIFLVTVASMIMNVFELVSKLVPILSLSDAFSSLRKETVDVQFLLGVIPAMLFSLAISLLALFFGCWLCKKNFEAYEENTNTVK